MNAMAMASVVDAEETESERERESSSISAGSSPRRAAVVESSDESGGESDRGGGSQGLVKAEPSVVPGGDESESESDGEESSDESEQDGGARVDAEQSSGSGSDGSETEEDDVMFKEQEEEEPDAAAVDDGQDSDFKEEEDEEDDDEETEGDLVEEEGAEIGPDGEESRRRVRAIIKARAFDPRRKGRDVPKRERESARMVLQHVQTFISQQERHVIAGGSRVTGPPIHEPLAQIERLARQFRWPKRLRNVRNTDFAQDPAEILEDFEVPVTASQALRHESRGLLDTSAFAAPPRPLMESAASALRQASRKRRRESSSEQPDTEAENEPSSPSSSIQEQALSSDAFVTLGRAGNTFSDRYMESLLKANLAELQGVGEQDAYSQRCWTPLPVSRKPVANWRFVFEHLLMNRDVRFGEPDDAFWPRMSTSTLQRIRDRLKTLFCATWQPADDNLFDLMTREGRQLDDVIHEDGAEEDPHVSVL